MGFMDKLSNMLGGNKKSQTENVKGPSLVLRESGIDPSDLKFAFNADGSLGVTGEVHTQAEADSIVKVLSGIPNVTSVDNNILVTAATPKPATVVEADTPTSTAQTANPVDASLNTPVDTPADTPATREPEAASAGRTYTVKPGDTLSAIAQKMYGSASKYHIIFQANTDQLENPDKILPGQVLIIPELDG